MMAKIGRGFSLIELMVVIAIVAVLAAVAVPAYQKYIVSSRAATFMTAADNLIEQMTEYANTHGQYPTPYNIGLSATSGNNQYVDDPAAINPHLSWIALGDNSTVAGHPAACGANGYVEVIARDDDAAWLGVTSAGALHIICNLGNHDGVIDKKCFSVLSDDYVHSIPGTIVPGTTNANTGYSYDYTNLNNFQGSADYTVTDCM